MSTPEPNDIPTAVNRISQTRESRSEMTRYSRQPADRDYNETLI